MVHGLQLVRQGSDAIVSLLGSESWSPIPRRRAGFSLRCSQSALIEVLHEVFREKDIQRPIDRYHGLSSFRARQFAPVNTAPEKP